MTDPRVPEFDTSVASLQARLDASPFNAWLGVRVTDIDSDVVRFSVPWRPEFIGTPQLGRMHGGVLTALADAAAGYTVMARTGISISTVDLRVDFHNAAGAENLTIEGSLIKLGRRLACVDVRIFNVARTLLASGRSTLYLASESR